MKSLDPRKLLARPAVLLVDAHDDTRELYTVALKSFGFEAITAADAAQAFGRASHVHPAIIVTEIALPEHDGWSLVRDLKRDGRTRDIPIVILTGYAEPAVRERAGREGCAAFLLKPYLPKELAQVLCELLGSAVRVLHERNTQAVQTQEPYRL
jgi:CheY-like chemotaxis protein